MQACNKGHALSWTMDSTGYMGGKYACDRCHKSTDCSNGRWACVPCKYDACPNCIAPPAPPVPMTALIMCKNMHMLEWSVDGSGYMAGKFSCDICKKTTECSAGRWSCKADQYDVCRICRPAEYNTCPKQHELVWSMDGSGYMAGKFSCDGCKKAYDCAFGRWTCPCKFDICGNCRQPPLPPPPPPVPMTAYVMCGKGHNLTWDADTSGYMAGTFSCDTCHKASKCQHGRWTCKEDKYDICHTCRPPVANKCAKMGHDLALSLDGAGYMMGKYSCDKCHKSYNCADGRYTCPCKYDLCPLCMQ
jgi:hypothetical protein